MALPMKKSVMKTTMKSKAKTTMKARAMKKKAVSKIARGKLAKVVVFKGAKEKTASGHSRSDLMKNKRNKVVSKKQNAAGKKAYKNIWARDSTSTRCVRALAATKVRKNHDRQSFECFDNRLQGNQFKCQSVEAHTACGIAGKSGIESQVFTVLREGKLALVHKISNLGERQLMGYHWTGITMAMDFELRMIFEMELQKHGVSSGDQYVEKKAAFLHFQEVLMEQIFEHVRFGRFLELRGVICEAEKLEDAEEKDGKNDVHCSHSEAKAEEAMIQDPAPGSTEDVSWDEVSGSKMAYGELRGGMQEIASQACSRSYYDKEAVLRTIQKEQTLRGGAGGASTTARKQQMREAIREMSAMVDGMPETQADSTQEDEAFEKIVNDIKQLAETWKSTKPSKEQMKQRLELISERLDKNIKSKASGGRAEISNTAPLQSFYSNFAQRFPARETTDGGKSAGKGKGKKGGKGKDLLRTLPRFDLQRVYPQKSITTWHLILRDLENGQMPNGEVAVCDSINRMAEIQQLAAVHDLDRTITLVAKAEGKDTDLSLVKNSKAFLLPYQGNLAMSRAIVATMNGKEPQDIGEKPIECKEPWNAGGKKVSLRITAVFKFMDPKMKDPIKQFPAHCLHALGCPEGVRECKTSGWSLDEEEMILVGYCLVDPAVVEQMLALSGTGGVFISQLKQNIVAKPPVTWYAKIDSETEMDFYIRVQKVAKENSVPMAWRRGGGLCLGVAMEDTTERAHSWICYGVPTFWGPLTLKEFLEKNSWKMASNPSPPKGRNKGWLVVGYIEGKKEQNFTYQLNEDDKQRHISIRKWEKIRKVETANFLKISGPKWWSVDDPIEVDKPQDQEMKEGDAVSPTVCFQPEVADTALDNDTDMEAEAKRKLETSTPAVKWQKSAFGAAKGARGRKVTGGQAGPGSSSLLDTGGRGDCGWRALAYMLAALNTRKSPEDIMARIDILSKTLRGKTTAYMVQHRHVWEPYWAVDAKWNETSEAGTPATDLTSFLEVIQRPLRWICGLGLASVAQLQRVNIVVFKADGPTDDWKIIARFCGAEDWHKLQIIPIVLDGGHYYALRKGLKGNNWPKEWMDVNDAIPCSQDFQMKGADKAIRGGADEEDPCAEEDIQKTPKRRLDFGEAEEEEDWLRTCSAGSATRSTLMGSTAKRRIVGKTSPSEVQFVPSSTSKKAFETGIGIIDGKEVVLRNASGHRLVRGIAHWKCPVCEEELTINKDERSGRCAVTKHMMKYHKAIWEEDRQQNLKWGRTKSSYSLTNAGFTN